MSTQAHSKTGRWLTFQAGSKYAGVSVRTLENWAKDGHFKVARVIAPGCIRGRNLIDRESLDAYIESFIGNPPRKLALNANREAASSVAAR